MSLDFLDGLILDNSILTRVIERLNILNEGEELSGDLFDERLEVTRENFLEISDVSVLPLIDIAFQRQKEKLGRGVSGEGPKFFITKEDSSFYIKSESGENPSYLSSSFKYQDWYFYIFFDGGEGEITPLEDSSRGFLTLSDSFTDLSVKPNVYEDGYFYGGLFQYGKYSLPDNENKISISIPFNFFPVSPFPLNILIDKKRTEFSYRNGFYIIREETPALFGMGEKRIFTVENTPVEQGSIKGYLLPESSIKQTAFNRRNFTFENLPSNFEEGTLVRDGEDTSLLAGIPSGVGYPLFEISYNFRQNIRDVIPWIFGFHISPFKDSTATLFNLICIQNGDRSFERTYGRYEGPGLVSENYWSGKVSRFEGTKIEERVSYFK